MIYGWGNLSGFEALAHQIMMRNELSNGYGAYQLGDAEIGRGGYSFGPVQWDLSANPRGQEWFEEIVTNARDSLGNLIFEPGEIDTLISRVIGHQDISADRDRINSALSSAYGQSVINANYLSYLKEEISYVEEIIARVPNPEERALLNTDLIKAWMVDYHNQFNIEGGDEITGTPTFL